MPTRTIETKMTRIDPEEVKRKIREMSWLMENAGKDIGNFGPLQLV